MFTLTLIGESSDAVWRCSRVLTAVVFTGKSGVHVYFVHGIERNTCRV